MSRIEPADAPSGSGPTITPLVTGDDGWERRGVIGAGMVGACVLGVVAGLWARPHDNGELVRLTAAREAYGPMPSQLQVVIEPDLRPPLQGPLPIAAGAEPVSVIQGAAPQVVAPAAPVAAAVPVVRIAPPAPVVVKAKAIEPPAPQAVRAKVEPAEPPVRRAKVEAEPRKPKAEPERLAKVEKTKAEKPKADVADRKPDKAEKTRLAKVEKAKADKAAEKKLAEQKASERKAEKTRLAKLEKKEAAAREKAEKAEKAELAKAELAKKEAAEKKAAARLAWLAKVERTKAEEKDKAAKAKLAKAEKAAPAPKAAPMKPVVQLAAAAKPAPARPAAVNAPSGTLDLQLAALRAEPLKVPASAPVPAPKPVAAPRPAPAPVARTCVADSRAEQLICTDPKLAAADRRLSAAYRRALQAGASPDRLRRQQGRWLAARAQAADEAPWALAEVYAVRIAELNDEADQAQSEN